MQLPKLYAQVNSKGIIDLTLSVNPLGCSPRVLKQFSQSTMSDISSYPDATKLLSALAKKLQVNQENILLGNGSEQLIKLVAQTFIRPEFVVVIEQGSFALFSKECLLEKATLKLVKLEKILYEINPKMIVLANPKTPTGEIISPAFLKRLIKKFKRTLIVIDEANGEFLEKSLINNAIKKQKHIGATHFFQSIWASWTAYRLYGWSTKVD